MNSSRCDWDNNFNQLLEVSAITAYELSYIIHKLTRTDDTQFCLNLEVYMCMLQERIQGGGGGAHPARAPLKLEKNMIFWRKIVIFHTK